MENPSYADLWQAYKAGDPAARSRFLVNFVPRITGLAKKFLRNQSQKEDVAQSIFLSFLANHKDAAGGVEKPDELWHLFAAITLRHCGKHNKRLVRERQRGMALPLGRKAAADDSAPRFEPADAGLPPDVQAAIHDLFEQCRKRLSERQQQILNLHLAQKERQVIADVLAIALPTVDRELKKIKTVLADLVGAEAD